MERPERAHVVARVFTHDEMTRLRAGLVPEEMEDKWFVVFTDDELRLYRSWTGHHIYTVRFEPAPWGERIAELLVDGASGVELEGACETLFRVIDILVLGRGLHGVPPSRGRTPAIVVERADITTVADDVIVNAANESLLGGGGVDGAIHRAAGGELLEACRSLPEVRAGIRCPTGEARITPAFGGLRARWVVHAVGPRWRGDGRDARLFSSAIRAALTLAEQYGAGSVALPAISCGVFGYPIDAAAEVAIGVVRERPWRLVTVRFALFDGATLAAWQRAVAAHPTGGTE